MLASVLVAPAVQIEEGPAYLTDSHGASGVVHAFLELTRSAPEYDPYWKGALDWLASVAKHDDEGCAYWLMSTSAPEGHPSNQINVAGMCHTIRMLFEGHERCGDKRYKDTALSAVHSLTERFAAKRETHLGTAYAWSHSYRPRNRSLGMLAGHSHGLGNLIHVILLAHKADPTDRTRAALEGLLINLRLRAKIIERDAAASVIVWPALKNPNVVETGYCYGQAGVVLGLAGAARYLEDEEILDAAKRVGDYIAARAEKAGGGYRFAQFHPIPETAGILPAFKDRASASSASGTPRRTPGRVGRSRRSRIRAGGSRRTAPPQQRLRPPKDAVAPPRAADRPCSRSG